MRRSFQCTVIRYLFLLILFSVCHLLRSGVAALFGPQSGTTSSHVQSICDAMEIPHIETRWDYRLKRDEYSVNLYPHPSALSKVREKRQLWTSFHIFLWKSAQQTWFCTLTEYTLERTAMLKYSPFKKVKALRLRSNVSSLSFWCDDYEMNRGP